MVRQSLHDALAALEAERAAALERTLAALVPTMKRATAEVSVVTGAPADVIVREAERRGSDLIVLGARGLGMVKRLLLGSVSEAVVRHAARPVLVVRP
jgi:nucleotide-binding universal stress UspA family protein